MSDYSTIGLDKLSIRSITTTQLSNLPTNQLPYNPTTQQPYHPTTEFLKVKGMQVCAVAAQKKLRKIGLF